MNSPSAKPSAARNVGEIIRFQTATGSVYEVARAPDGMRWRRISASLASGPLRNDGARLLRWPGVHVGDSCLLLSEPFVPPHPRLVWTSQVVAILEHAAEAPQRAVAPAPSPFRALKVGDTVTRLIAGSIPMKLVVTDVDERFVYCGGPGGWKFDRDSGHEVDEELGWGPQFGVTGSFLVPNHASASEEGE